VSREFLAAIFLAALPGCLVVDSNKDDAADAGDEHPPCDEKGDCAACVSCATSSLCAAQLDACQKSSACVGLDQCLPLCGADVDCKQQCVANNSDGAALFEAADRCLRCEQCPKDCAGSRPCD